MRARRAARACRPARRSSRADAARRSARRTAGRDGAPRGAAAPASPGGRGARRRSCRSSARTVARGRGGRKPRKTCIAGARWRFSGAVPACVELVVGRRPDAADDAFGDDAGLVVADHGACDGVAQRQRRSMRHAGNAARRCPAAGSGCRTRSGRVALRSNRAVARSVTTARGAAVGVCSRSARRCTMFDERANGERYTWCVAYPAALTTNSSGVPASVVSGPQRPSAPTVTLTQRQAEALAGGGMDHEDLDAAPSSGRLAASRPPVGQPRRVTSPSSTTRDSGVIVQRRPARWPVMKR